MESPAVLSARRHVSMYEESIRRRKADIEQGTHTVDEETTRRWLAFDEEELAAWKRSLSQAIAAATPVAPLA